MHIVSSLIRIKVDDSSELQMIKRASIEQNIAVRVEPRLHLGSNY